MGNLTDPSNLIMYEMHQYLDSDGSGTSPTCVSSAIGSERLVAATEWLRSIGKKGILGELAGAVNSVCEAAVKDMLNYMLSNTDVGTGAIWWAAVLTTCSSLLQNTMLTYFTGAMVSRRPVLRSRAFQRSRV